MLENKDIKKESDVTSTDEVVKNDVTENAIMRMNRRTFVKMAGVAAGALAFGRFAFRPAAAAQSGRSPARLLQKSDYHF